MSTRYVLEDVPYGLVPIVRLAGLCGLTAPLHRSGIEILNACYGRNFSVENDLLSEIGQTDFETLPELCRDGYGRRVLA